MGHFLSADPSASKRSDHHISLGLHKECGARPAPPVPTRCGQDGPFSPRQIGTNRGQVLRPEMLAWLTNVSVVQQDGGVNSWVNDRHPGYRYPEIAGLLLLLLSREGAAYGDVSDQIARALAEDVSPLGGIGRGGRDYTFDTAMALSGLLEHETVSGRVVEPGLTRRLADFLDEALSARCASSGREGPAGDSRRWSRCYGSHLLKVSFSLCAYVERTSDRHRLRHIGRLMEDLIPLYERGRFRNNRNSPETYLHAHCYAVEGLLCIQCRGLGDVGRIVSGAADWLTTIQDPDGGIPAWHDGQTRKGSSHADATAQAVRIWACLDPANYAEPIARSIGFLAGLGSPCGGIRYCPGNYDVNTWATIFAIQAVRWAETGGDPLLII
jgi:hypothetical protein